MRTLPATTDVVIVGSGPTGLVLGCVLAMEGIPFALVDKLAEGANTSRAAVVHARTLEVLENIGVTDRLHAEGLEVPLFTMRDRDRVLARVGLQGLPTRYPYALMVPQSVTEAILLDRLRELGAQVHRPYTVTDVAQDEDAVTVTAIPDGQQPQKVRARYIIGADGMHSIVRERAGIGFIGETYEQSFVLADVRMRWPLRAEEVTLFFSPGGLVVVAPLPGGRHRVVATMDDAPEVPGITDVQNLLDERGPRTNTALVEQVVWSSRFRVHHRLADHYRKGRILLAGDAAHVHSPAGGQGMNTSIQDAIVLGHAIAGVLTGHPESLLDGYERMRRPVAERVVTLTDRLTRAATLRSPLACSLRNAILGVLGRIPALQQWIAIELAELKYR